VSNPSEHPARLIAALLVEEAAREEMARKRAELAAAIERERAERQAAEDLRARLEAERLAEADRQRVQREVEGQAEEARKAREAQERENARREEGRQQRRREIEAQEAQKRAAIAAHKARKQAIGPRFFARAAFFNALTAILPAVWPGLGYGALGFTRLPLSAAGAAVVCCVLGRWAAVGGDGLASMMLNGILFGAPLTIGVFLYMLHGSLKINAVPPFAVLLLCPAVQVAYVLVRSLLVASREAQGC
jgi:hypothetical protein